VVARCLDCGTVEDAAVTVPKIQSSAPRTVLVRSRAKSTMRSRVPVAWIVATRPLRNTVKIEAPMPRSAHSVVAMLTVGDFTRETGERFGISAYRRANLLDVTVGTYPFLLP